MATKNPTKPRRRTALAKRQTSTPQAYTMTKKERELADAFRNRCDETAPAVGFRMKDEGNSLEVGLDHPDKAVGELLFTHALGTTNADFANGLINQLGNVLGKGKAPNAAGLNHIVAIVQGIAPRDETEALLAAQMAAIHNATMTAARRLNHVETLTQQDSASNMLNKLARTFAGQ